MNRRRWFSEGETLGFGLTRSYLSFGSFGGLQAIAAMKRTNIPASANTRFPINTPPAVVYPPWKPMVRFPSRCEQK